MTVKLIRFFFVILSVICGYYVGSLLTGLSVEGAYLGAGAGFGAALFLIVCEMKLKHVSLRNLSAAVFGLIFGFFMAWIMTIILRLVPMDDIFYAVFQIIFTLVFCYLGMIIAIKGKDEFNLVIPYVRFSREDEGQKLLLLDTSVIIDGRIAGICETGFISGRLVIPRFVLQELHQISDSSDELKRERGRRGLDMLNTLKALPGQEVIVHEEILPEIKGVDSKLVRLAKLLDCQIMTNDFNLNKVAKLEGVQVLNINELAGAMRPVVFPGEIMSVYIRKEGKEKNQGISFMDDGTMIVVDNARKLIGKNVSITVASVLQTSAGRMIFAALNEKPEQKRENTQQKRNNDQRGDRGENKRPQQG